MLGTSPVISHFDPERETSVATDASNFAVGAVLYQQKIGSPKKFYVKFIHRNLSGGQLNYSATKREFYGIIFALTTFHNFLYGIKFQLMTDHKALTYIFTQPKPNAMISRWHETLLAYNFTITHIPDIKNVLPDAISRMYPPVDSDRIERKRAVYHTKTIDHRLVLKTILLVPLLV